MQYAPVGGSGLQSVQVLQRRDRRALRIRDFRPLGRIEVPSLGKEAGRRPPVGAGTREQLFQQVCVGDVRNAVGILHVRRRDVHPRTRTQRVNETKPPIFHSASQETGTVPQQRSAGSNRQVDIAVGSKDMLMVAVHNRVIRVPVDRIGE